nr:uncharacterized protein LOC26530572 isoform X2 [Drosophila virilis]
MKTVDNSNWTEWIRQTTGNRNARCHSDALRQSKMYETVSELRAGGQALPICLIDFGARRNHQHSPNRKTQLELALKLVLGNVKSAVLNDRRQLTHMTKRSRQSAYRKVELQITLQLRHST